MSQKTVDSGQWTVENEDMKRSVLTYGLIGGLAVLLVVLGVFQYRWLSQISESDSEKAKIRVKEQAERFAMDFDREIQSSYFNFQTDADTWKAKDWTAFNERYDYWKKNTPHPDLITDFYFFEIRAGAASLRYDTGSQAFVEVEETPELTSLRSKFADPANFRPVDAESLTLFLPIHKTEQKVEKIRVREPMPDSQVSIKMPERIGFLAIRLDPVILKDGLIADLKAKYFGDGDFAIAVTDSGGNAVYQSLLTDTVDASAPMFDLTPDKFVFFTNKDLIHSIGGESAERMVVNSKVENHTVSRMRTTDQESGKVTIEVKGDTGPRTSIFTTTTTNLTSPRYPWTLSVQHSSGSLSGYSASLLRRNLAIGLGILFLLAGAVAAIVISSMRARALAQRQIDFVSSVSHEFRTPLAVIYSAGENLADGIAKETIQVSRYGDLIKGEGRKLSSMVEQILEFAGANAGRRRFSFAPTSVADVVSSAVAESRSLVGDRPFEIETDIADNLPAISADKAALSQAVENLVANSIKYCNGDAWLKVTASNGDCKVKITVEDRGIGISKSDLRQIFEPFYRSKEVVDAQIHGNGLGLSLVKQIVEAHGGSVKAESEIGKGSTFTLEFPQN